MSATAPAPLPDSDLTVRSEPCPDQPDAVMGDLARLSDGTRRDTLRDLVIRMLLPMARRVSRRFQRQGVDFDDLVQVASVGLIKAVDGYDPHRGHAFLSYAIPKLTGEIRRHLRDRTAAVRLPRSLQEASGPVFRAAEELQQRLGDGSPTPDQIAEHTGLETDRVASTLRALHECRPRSLDEPARSDQESPLAFLIGSEDAALGRVVDTVALVTEVRQLPERDRRVLYPRFYPEQTQQQIADVIGVSQMQVSRILRRCLVPCPNARYQEAHDVEHLRERTWVIPEGFVPGSGTVFFPDREPAGPYEITGPARHTSHQRFNELGDLPTPRCRPLRTARTDPWSADTVCSGGWA
ncbi:sigma-70 family RNA polymerase sigma factor [Streptomyces albogriseolus]|uniref:sigma-70 family RNA polymerase sigma factor n=1 Tax=Streptomyces albogriseolus TaxID=1887 RepID=UPI003D71BFD6